MIRIGSGTHHPLPCLMFLLPLIAVYEYGVFALGGAQADAMRNGADAWIRYGLYQYGVQEFLAAPACLVAGFLLWTIIRWHDRPERPFGLVLLMLTECVLYGFALWMLVRYFEPLLRLAGVPLQVAGPINDEILARLVTFVGAGIYEEVIFRLILLNGIAWFLRFALFPKFLAYLVAAGLSSLMFALAHHVGPHGETEFIRLHFFFRVAAGFYFCAIYRARGFAVAVGAHAVYDVMVGIPWEMPRA
jgi:membrane protease YdiL (CAAX protease family)